MYYNQNALVIALLESNVDVVRQYGGYDIYMMIRQLYIKFKPSDVLLEYLVNTDYANIIVTLHNILLENMDDRITLISYNNITHKMNYMYIICNIITDYTTTFLRRNYIEFSKLRSKLLFILDNKYSISIDDLVELKHKIEHEYTSCIHEYNYIGHDVVNYILYKILTSNIHLSGYKDEDMEKLYLDTVKFNAPNVLINLVFEYTSDEFKVNILNTINNIRIIIPGDYHSLFEEDV